MSFISTKGKYMRQKPSGRRWLRILPLFILIPLLLTAVIGSTVYFSHLNQAADDFQQLAQAVHSAAPTAPSALETEPLPAEEVSSTDPTIPKAPKVILPQFVGLHAQNPDFFGWLTIPDTKIDYPVMHTPAEPEKYLYANFQGEYSFGGTPFLSGSCTDSSTNMIIYAHNLLDGSMFRSLLRYEQKDYWQRHPVIQLTTLYEPREYEVIASFYDRVYYSTEDHFKFYQFIQAENADEFDEAIAYFKEKALFDTELTAEYGDKLLTLVTCAYHTDNGRFVVVARQK